MTKNKKSQQKLIIKLIILIENFFKAVLVVHHVQYTPEVDEVLIDKPFDSQTGI